MRISIRTVIIFVAVLLNIGLLYKTSALRSEIVSIRKQKETDRDRISSAIKFDKYKHDFAYISQGIPVQTNFTFTNKSAKVMKIANIESSCGCTIPKWDSSIHSGSKGNVQLSFDALAVGAFNKVVNVYVDGEEKPIQLSIEGIVK